MAYQYKYYPSALRQIRLFVLLFLVFSVTSLAKANTVKWAIPPDFDNLVPYYDGVYKYALRTTIGLIDDTGVVIDGSQCDSVMPANADGLALLLQDVGSSEATLVGIFNCKKKQVIPVNGGLKVNPIFAFFSNDRLPVRDNAGNWGYLGIDGQLAIPCQYKAAWPFSLQRAPVRLNNKDKNVVYIKEDGTRITVLVNNGIIGDGTPIFMDGTADVAFNGKYSRITSNGNKRNNITKNEYRSIKDWLSEYNQSMAKSVEVSSLDTTSMLAFLGSQEGQIINEQVSVFSTHGDQAIVGYKGKVGLLQLVQGDFSMNQTSFLVNVEDRRDGVKVDPKVLKLEVSIPDEINLQELSYYMNDYETASTPKGSGAQELQFETSRYASLKSSTTEDIIVDVKDYHGLLLFNEKGAVNITYSKEKEPEPKPKPDPKKCSTCHLDISKCLDNGKHKKCQKCRKIIDSNHRVINRCPHDGTHPIDPQPKPPPT